MITVKSQISLETLSDFVHRHLCKLSVGGRPDSQTKSGYVLGLHVHNHRSQTKPLQSEEDPVSIKSPATISPPAKRHLNGVLLAN